MKIIDGYLNIQETDIACALSNFKKIKIPSSCSHLYMEIEGYFYRSEITAYQNLRIMYAVNVGEMIKSWQRPREIGEMEHPISEYNSDGWQ